ncbi:hypothetical protein EDD16DRAFT_1499119 [Pisolithus croceorrhizus]|nr:hypothetical protein EDD16DRAFT_1499119 [Pisolithus croceorrhizus]KAI6130167.1 hypothetical protein EV401DRAFT_2223278 [Pisolithus croceorrhizus]KAI6164550.1 hypothetical protein EDD17DRAFT_1561121 [Pisolithus thermaeus]
MADCGICLETLKNPVSTPCGHIHCEACLRNYIISGNDALKSICPTCRQEFHIATPDLAVVPEKYHDFILPTIRKLYIDIPSVSKLSNKVKALNNQVKTLSREMNALEERCDNYGREVQAFAAAERETRSEMHALQHEYDQLRSKYDILSAAAHGSVMSIDPQLGHSSGPHTASSSSVPNHGSCVNDAITVSDNTLVGGETTPSLVQLRPKRALPKSRTSQHSYVPGVSTVSKRRVGRHSGAYWNT